MSGFREWAEETLNRSDRYSTDGWDGASFGKFGLSSLAYRNNLEWFAWARFVKSKEVSEYAVVELQIMANEYLLDPVPTLIWIKDVLIPAIAEEGIHMACSLCGEEGHYAPTCERSGNKVTSKKATKKKSIWTLVEEVIPESRLTLLFGPPGTGKTTAANMIGNVGNVYNLTLTEETPAAELRGHFIPKGTEFIWHDGPAVRAFKEGARLVFNELDKASGDALTFCHALCDDPGIARITLPTGETLYPHEGFTVVATMNGVPSDLPDALRDRFTVAIEVNEIHPDALAALPEDLRTPAANGLSYDTERGLSLRAWKTFAQLRDTLGEDKAAQAIFGSRAETILNLIKIGEIKA